MKGQHARSSRMRHVVLTRHREILRRVLLGEKVVDIARALGYAPVSVGIVVRSPGFQAELAKVQEKVLEHLEDEGRRLRSLAGPSVEFYKSTLENEQVDRGLRFKIAKDVLDRVGFRAPERREVRMGFGFGDGDFGVLGEGIGSGSGGGGGNDPAEIIMRALEASKRRRAEIMREEEEKRGAIDVEVVGGDGADRDNGEKDDGDVKKESGDVRSGYGDDSHLEVQDKGETLDLGMVFEQVKEILGDEEIEVVVDDAMQIKRDKGEGGGEDKDGG